MPQKPSKDLPKFTGMDSLSEEDQGIFSNTNPISLSKETLEGTIKELQDRAKGKVMTPEEIQADGGIPILQWLLDYIED